MNKNFALFALILIAFCSVAQAQTGHMKILAVSEDKGTSKGMTADLYLEVQPGNGKVFIESFPLTRMDTQISTRFAKEIACTEMDIDCSKFNFFYTIRADTALVGGPSAGAAAAVLTAAVLSDLQLDEHTALTGTINSGGLIGPVGGLSEKITGSSELGITKVLIPKGQRNSKLDDNQTVDLIELGAKNGIEVIEVSDLRQAIYEFTGEKLPDYQEDFSIDLSYTATMQKLATTICNRKYEGDLTNETYMQAQNLSKKGEAAIATQQYYSAASFCFGANVKYRYLSLIENQSLDILQQVQITLKDAQEFEKSLPKIKTVTDVQTYGTVRERLLDAQDNLNKTIEYAYSNRTLDAIYSLAYAQERVFSARAWGQFLGGEGKQYDVDREVISNTCRDKIAEAEERLQYVRLYLPEALSTARTDINRAYEDLATENYELCISKASKAKAESDVLLNALGVDQEEIPELLTEKLNAAKRTIIRNSNKGIFPIIGYSYYEYAASLKETDPYSALLYAEYALELSNLDIYFNKEPAIPKKEIKIDRLIVGLAGGIIIGSIITAIIASKARPKRIVKRASIKRRTKP